MKIRSNKITNKELLEFIRVFSLLLYSKVGITDSLELIQKKTGNAFFCDVIKKILKDLKSGHSLSKSFSKYPGYFNDLFIANLRVAEETGQIAEVVGDYANYLEKMQNLKRKILQAVRYPLFVIIIAVAVVFFMFTYIIPTFQSLFSSVKTGLPPLTQFLLDISNLFVNNGSVMLIIIIAAVIMSFTLNKNKILKQKLLDALVGKVPFISTLYMSNLLARFSLSMAVLLKSKVGLLEALKISKSVSSNLMFRKQIDSIIKKLIRGENFSSNLSNSKFFDLTFSKLLAAGEESAELDKVFLIISEYYGDQFDHYLDNLTSLLEPALILVIGSIVAVILVGLYLPMFDVVNYFGV
jgi:type IV pilus assembly protein PilC